MVRSTARRGIEEAIVDQSPYIQLVMLYNNQNPYTVGMVVPDIEAINRELKKPQHRKRNSGRT